MEKEPIYKVGDVVTITPKLDDFRKGAISHYAYPEIGKIGVVTKFFVVRSAKDGLVHAYYVRLRSTGKIHDFYEYDLSPVGGSVIAQYVGMKYRV